MSLKDDLLKMKRKGRQVVSVDFVLEALREPESDCKDKISELVVEEPEAV